ncbi:MAG: carbon-nitrogen hydrolase family protein, partial [Pyrinomonadaceae bacterium]|nr:carbon-nitrogen hydrolase family protein [Pyrinomonadaceae bacterium]
MREKNVKVALIQEPPVFLNLKETISKAGALASEANDSGAQIIVFPETWFPGYPIWLDDAPTAGFWDYP